ncbi:MAG TPA: LCP family protein [Anaerolineales bacterium]|nr:LCP family protein [Anaerolineales bacterium]
MRNITKYVILISLLILSGLGLSSCKPAGVTYASEFEPTYTPETIYITADPNYSQPPPFQPMAATPTHSGPLFPTATVVGTPDANNGEAATSGGPVSQSAAGPIQEPDNQVNILLLGSDQRPYSGGFRTDVFLLMTINLDDQTINLTSFPRDLYVYLPGLYNDRINTAMARGGFTLVSDTLEYNFGFRPDYYALVNFWGFSDVIDTFGGINVNVGQTLTDHRSGYGDYTVNAGTVHMDGETALWYVRSRYTSSDFDRGRRQQEVLFALMSRLISFDVVSKFPELYEQYQNTIETNLPLSEISPLLPVADEFFSGQIGRYAIGPAQTTDWITPGGAMVLLPNQNSIRAILLEALNAE